MNTQAAVFACRFTGFIGILASLLFWKMYGITGLSLGLAGSIFWFGLGLYFQRTGGKG
ncbi:hypothetical protein GCM10007416_28030 [Kroppenstedtia guangzhouensis]|jgi:hypothetical protein|uniref:Uncharacterized protein n=1 Tax=Kroppenstedtia guangzhouensis TaxID=1274356 RepID=A0ABQ1GZW5_9BACL|nr:hypothetical protein [Kroppenstedtia guangzhouensis]GGA53310.1 hypothetical protein GCM10007416_28030 [Kroppenstedtia guangzhouensis]